MIRLRKFYEQTIIGNMTPFRVQSSGQDDYADIENLNAFQKGCYLMINDKYKHIKNQSNIPYISNNYHVGLQLTSLLIGVVGFRLICHTTLLRSLSTLSLVTYQFYIYKNQASLNSQTFLLRYFNEFEDNEQKALLTGDARYFYESFGDLKKDTKTQRVMMV